MKIRPLLIRLGVVAGSMLVAVLAVELGMRWKAPEGVEDAGIELRLFKDDQAKSQRLYQLDPVLGFRPIFGTEAFAEHGARPNDYDLERPRAGADRVLFLGDSVVFRNRLVNAVRKAYGEEPYEYWNGGVTAYNTTQEVEYFRRYTSKTHPRQIVLTFHPNDFMTTPITFRDPDGDVRVIAPARSRAEVNAFLFRWSYVYRWFIGKSRAPVDDSAIVEIKAQLADLKELCAQDGASLTVLLLPNLDQLENWRPIHTRRHALMLATFRELGLRTFDLKPALEIALAQGIDVQETPGDKDHPSDAVCAVFAEYLKEQGLLYPPGAAPLSE